MPPFGNFRIAACITTMHRPDILRDCLSGLMACDSPPDVIVVSDDSREPAQIAATQAVVAEFPRVLYTTGPRRGVCANRNSALTAAMVANLDYVAFLDDDTAVPPDFFSAARAYLGKLEPTQRVKTILTGYRDDVGSGASRLNFRGYFEDCAVPETATVCASFFPMALLATERWDENIFFGSEDAEICLRAMARGFQIQFSPTLRTKHLATDAGVLQKESSNGMTKYELQCEAARLYIGIKRYSRITPNRFKLYAFVGIYFAHLAISLARRGLIKALPPIVRAANLGSLRQTGETSGSTEQTIVAHR
ncbi:glycosyltransferase family 2 protein [Paraburkholderia antibiotica]|uniref:Glycosyltransferase family 2 protein n=1 Tax=Paraburkholderia antibiotica TaxID=2728839 RepID=A0A7X9X2Z3_9BURK|nr:glycosyltransferase [Paraburkholderia antibiotica]NML30470.1 glycosyltransferase family 2 protein [Paraburkholderia antibiotica]